MAVVMTNPPDTLYDSLKARAAKSSAACPRCRKPYWLTTNTTPERCICAELREVPVPVNDVIDIIRSEALYAKDNPFVIDLAPHVLWLIGRLELLGGGPR